MHYIKIVKMCNAILTVCITQCFSIPLQVQHQTTVMGLWWMTRGVPAHLLLSHYLLNPGRGAQAKALLTNPKVSTPMIFLRKVLTKGNFFLHLYNVKSKGSWFSFNERIFFIIVHQCLSL